MIASKLSTDCALYDCRTRNLSGARPENPKAGSSLNFATYDVVVIGTAMYMGRPMKEVVKFCYKHAAALADKKLVFFTCGIGTAQEDEGYLWKHMPDALKAKSPAYYHMGGEIHGDRLNFFGRMAMQEYMKKHGESPCIDSNQVAEACEALNKSIRTEGDAIPCKV
jgi:menaquinone-dependent protoporphyrinogen IX oxidase